MAPIHHVVTGNGRPPIVFVHGFACAHSNWDAQVAYLSPRHQTVAVDLRGHGPGPGTADECSSERYGADVVEVMRALDLPPPPYCLATAWVAGSSSLDEESYLAGNTIGNDLVVLGHTFGFSDAE